MRTALLPFRGDGSRCDSIPTPHLKVQRDFRASKRCRKHCPSPSLPSYKRRGDCACSHQEAREGRERQGRAHRCVPQDATWHLECHHSNCLKPNLFHGVELGFITHFCKTWVQGEVVGQRSTNDGIRGAGGPTVSPKRYRHVLTSGTYHVTLFGNRVLEDVIRMRSHESRVGPNPMTGVLIRRGGFAHRQRKENTMGTQRQRLE